MTWRYFLCLCTPFTASFFSTCPTTKAILSVQLQQDASADTDGRAMMEATPYTTLHVNMWRCFLCIFKCTALKPRYILYSHPFYMHICPLFLSQAFRQHILAALCLLFMSQWSSLWICGCWNGAANMCSGGNLSSWEEENLLLQNHRVTKVGKIKESTH